jgi:hypothetical protein
VEGSWITAVTRPFWDHLSRGEEKRGCPHLGVHGSGVGWSTSYPSSKPPRHRRLRSAAGEGVFMEDDELGCVCFTDIVRGCVLQLLGFVDAVAVSTRGGDARFTCSTCTRGARRCVGGAGGALRQGRFLHSCASMTSASATSSCTSSVGIASVGPACNSGLRVVVVPLLSRRCGRRQRHQPPQPRIGGAVLHTRGRREITEGRALQSLLPFFRTSR